MQSFNVLFLIAALTVLLLPSHGTGAEPVTTSAAPDGTNTTTLIPFETSTLLTTTTSVPTSTDTPTTPPPSNNSSTSTTSPSTTSSTTTTMAPATTTAVPTTTTTTPAPPTPPPKVYPKREMLSHLSFAALILVVIGVYYLALLISSMAVGESPDLLLMPLRMLKTLALSCYESLCMAVDRDRSRGLQGYQGLQFDDDEDEGEDQYSSSTQQHNNGATAMTGPNRAIRIVE